jgi:N-acyl homoserine lactone hydrolase
MGESTAMGATRPVARVTATAGVKRVSVLSTGHVRIRPQHAKSDGTPALWWLFTSRRWTRSLPINVYVIEHDKGLLLFDTGQDRRTITDRDYFPSGFAGLIYRRLAKFAIGVEETLTARLLVLGYKPEGVTTVVVSHLHQDHIGGLRELPNAKILVDAAEWKRLDSPFAEINGFLVRRIRIPGLNWQTVTPEPTNDKTIAPFTRAHDVFGDGSLLLLPTPGHTAGSLSLFVRRRNLPPLLLVGDLTYDARGMEHGEVPGLGSRNHVERSIEAVLELRRNNPGLVILAAHDPKASEMLADSSPVSTVATSA